MVLNELNERTSRHAESLLRVDELAAHLAVPRSWVYSHTSAGDIPCVRVGRYVRFRLSEVLDWLGADGR